MPPAAATITNLTAREVLDCRGLPTVQVDLGVGQDGFGRADVPSGRSTGSREAVELRDGGRRFGGYGVRTAVQNVNGPIAAALIGTELTSQSELDQRLIEVDGSPDKRRLGANALLGVSLAAARAIASLEGVPLYQSISQAPRFLPVPQLNLINGGLHASNDLDFQEFMIVPTGASSFMHAMEIGTEVNLALADILRTKFGKAALNTGDEGGFAPPIDDPEEALGCLHRAVADAGYVEICAYGLDCAATNLYDRDEHVYAIGERLLGREDLIDFYCRLAADYSIVTIEDPLHEDDFAGFAELNARTGDAVQIVGDDLLVTNVDRVAQSVETGAANALLWKVNQVGTLSEALDAAELARQNGYSLVVSERSGETEDTIIADLAVGLGAGQIKAGAPVRGERTAKYNRLLIIEEELGIAARYAGHDFRRPFLS